MQLQALKQDARLAFWFAASEHLTDAMQQQLYRYYQLIAEYNQKLNLTGIDDLSGVYLKHFYDSLTITSLIEAGKNLTIGDLGSGAGLPGIVLAIIYPNHNLYLIEPITKRANFLNLVVKELALTNTTVLNQRAEDVTIKFDYLVSRAVARLNILLELAVPIICPHGHFIALKGAAAQVELTEAETAMKTLSVQVEKIDEITLPIENSHRCNILFYKVGSTPPQYPRNFAQIKKKPL